MGVLLLTQVVVLNAWSPESLFSTQQGSCLAVWEGFGALLGLDNEALKKSSKILTSGF